jgi:hypothetical protein
MRLNSAERQSGNVGGVSVAVTKREAEHSASPTFWRQRVHRTLNIKAGAVVCCRCARGWVVQGIEITPTRLPAVMVEKAAIGDAQQPTADILNLGQAVGDPERFEKGLLRQLISKGTIPTEPAQESSNRALMGADNRVECVDL